MTHDVIQRLEAYGEYADAVAPAIRPMNSTSAAPVHASRPADRND